MIRNLVIALTLAMTIGGSSLAPDWRQQWCTPGPGAQICVRDDGHVTACYQTGWNSWRCYIII